MPKIVDWIEHNPLLAGGLIVGGGLVILWYMGFFTKAQASSDGGTANLAAAYYAAEAAQGVAGTQLAMQQSSDTAQTAQVGLQATAATSIAQIQANTTTALSWNDLMGLQTVTGASADVAKTQSLYDLYATQTLSAASTHNADVTAAGAVAHDQYALLTTQDNNKANVFTSFFNTVWPAELARTGGTSAGWLGSFGNIGLGGPSGTPEQMRAAGYSANQIAAAWPPG
jgi:uncharacterized protein YfiM (DUF2279 family)